MTDITFSVIINCKNSEKYLKEAVDSVLDQSYENFEIIIVDNNSKDSTSKIIKSLGDFRIKYFKLNNSLSLGEARNFGLKNSNGKFIGFLDSDDFWHCEKLEKSLIQFNNDQIALVYSNVNYFNEKDSFQLYSNLKPFSKFIFNDIINNYNLCISSCVFSRMYLNKMDQLFDLNLEVCEDFDFFLRLSRLGEADYIDEVLVNYRIHSNNLTKTKRLLFFEEKEYVINKLISQFQLKQKMVKSLFFENKLDKAKYYWKTNKNNRAIKLILKSSPSNHLLKMFYFILFLFRYNFILKVYSLFKYKNLDIEI